MKTAGTDRAVDARREFLARLGPGLLCALVAWMFLPAIAALILIRGAVALHTAGNDGDRDG